MAIITTMMIIASAFMVTCLSVTGSAVSTTGETQGGNSNFNLNIEHAPDTDFIQISWKFDEETDSDSNTNTNTNDTDSYAGFVVSYSLLETDGDKEGPGVMSDKGLIFQSAHLEPSVRSLIFHPPEPHSVRICVTTKGANRTIRQSRMACSNWSVSHHADDSEDFNTRKLITGVVAGGVFLIPCTVLIIYILRKDKQMNLAALMGEEEFQKLNQAFQMEDATNHKPSHRTVVIERQGLSQGVMMKDAGQAGVFQMSVTVEAGVGVVEDNLNSKEMKDSTDGVIEVYSERL